MRYGERGTKLATVLGVIDMRRTICLLTLGFFIWASGSAGADDKDVQKNEPLLSKDEELKADDPKDKKQTRSPCKTYKVKLAEGKTYQIDLKSKDFDAFLRVEDAAGKEVAFNDDSPAGSTFDSRILYTTPQAGEYGIIATCLNAKPGRFNLTVVDISHELVLKNGHARYEGELTKDDLSDLSKHFKLFTVKLDAGKTYRIDQRGADPAFDAYLILEDIDGKKLAEDDDSGGGLNARITHKISKSGTYRVIATTFSRQTGKFALEIVATGG
jgi:hypothetical protein